METFSALLAICAENSPVPGEFPTQRPVTRSFDVFFYGSYLWIQTGVTVQKLSIWVKKWWILLSYVTLKFDG